MKREESPRLQAGEYFNYPRLLPLLHPDVKGMIAAIQQDPVGFEQHFSQMATADGLWQLIIGMSAECDRILYESDTFSQSFRRALQEGFSQGAQAYARDLVNALGSWPMNKRGNHHSRRYLVWWLGYQYGSLP